MRIALIAHDKKKTDMINLAVKYKETLSKHELFATGTTGTLVIGETGLAIHRMKSGPLGGDQQIGSMIACNQLDLVIFLRDPLTAQPHEPDVSALLRLCDRSGSGARDMQRFLSCCSSSVALQSLL